MRTKYIFKSNFPIFLHFFQVVNRKTSFLSKESDIEILQSQSIYFVYEVGIISSYSNITFSGFIAKSC